MIETYCAMAGCDEPAIGEATIGISMLDGEVIEVVELLCARHLEETDET